MASVCFVCVCDVRHLGKRIYKQCSDIYQEWQGRQRARVPPPPPRAERRLGYPQANFFIFPSKIFIFFLPYPITSSIYPFSFPLRGFLFLCVYFLTCVSFRGSEGKKTGKIRIAFLSYLFLCGYYTPYSRSLLFSSAVFFADLPILLPSVGLSLFLRIIIRLGVFRGSEAEKSGFVL